MKINKERIKILIKKKTLKQKDIAKKLNIDQQDFNNWMFRGIFPHFNKLEELADILETDIHELYFSDNIAEPSPIYQPKFSIQHEEMIPFYEIDTQIGHAALWLEKASIEAKEYVYLPGIKADFILTYFGKGMEPQLENGDWVALRRIEDRSFFNFGQSHAILTQEQFIFRILNKGVKQGTVLLSTITGESEAIELPETAIKSLFSLVVIVKRNQI